MGYGKRRKRREAARYEVTDPFGMLMAMGDGSLSPNAARLGAAILLRTMPELRGHGFNVDTVLEVARETAQHPDEARAWMEVLRRGRGSEN